MAIRRLTVVGAVAAVLLWCAPLSAQLQPAYTWTAKRPDGIAPIGVSADRTYPKGTLSLSYRFTGVGFGGQRIGQSPIALSQAQDMFFLVPTRQQVTMNLVGASFGLTDRLTLEGQVPVFVTKTMDQITANNQRFTNQTGGSHDTSRRGFGDVKVWAHLLGYDQGPYRAHFTMGLSIPVGSITQEVTTPVSAPQATRAPYPMQIGSGSWDVLPGFTFLAMNDVASTGIQVNTTLRLNDNSMGYRLGNRFQGSIWGAYKVSDMVSTSVRLTATELGDVSGADPVLNPNLDPASAPDLQGSTEVEMPFGLNIYFPSGFLKGNRLGVEASVPIYRNVHGPQLTHGWTLTLGWQYDLPLSGGS